MAFLRAGIPIAYSSGYNPLPVLEIVSPLAVGITGANETAAAEFHEPVDLECFKQKLNNCLVDGICIGNAFMVYIPYGTKKHSLSSLYWGSIYETPEKSISAVKFMDEKNYRQFYKNNSSSNTYWGLKRLEVLAKDPGNPDSYKSYFEVYKELYQIN
jgi:radical SAM-linked protein